VTPSACSSGCAGRRLNTRKSRDIGGLLEMRDAIVWIKDEKHGRILRNFSKAIERVGLTKATFR
jgi:hypothetical protein